MTQLVFTRTEPFTWKDPQKAFDQAIQESRLTATLGSLYAGHYMYMGTRDGRDLFKHGVTRRYLA